MLTAQSLANAVPDCAARPLVKLMLGNLAKDSANEKYRKINLAGKAGAKLAASPEAMALLRAVGFVELPVTDDGAHFFAETIDADAVNGALQALEPAAPAAPAPAPRTAVPVDESKLSTRQQQRLAVERRDKAERDAAKRLRSETVAQIQRDNYARKHDENWKTTEGVNKGGKDISTFRGKFGEEEGG
ncbi:hypothetical protein M885DRAFT_523294 [Pelagophyceae sp. CCMP2097]|nr:hypothetical protein M885DRAFT_523294 [Pelagophyceae sp. CCMP2097]